MKNSYLTKILISLILICSLTFSQAHDSTDLELQKERAQTLYTLGILKGYPDGSLGLNDNIKRCEFFTMVIRILGYENDFDTTDVKLPFPDINKSHWAFNNVKAAYKLGLINGNPDGTLTPDNYITYSEVLAVLIRALGYSDPGSKAGKWPDRIINLAKSLGMTKDIDIPASKQVTRGEASVIIYNTLTVNFKK